MKAHKNIDKPTSYAYYLKDTVTPSYDEIQTGIQQSQRESQRPSRRNSKKRKNESAKKNNTRIESKDQTYEDPINQVELDFEHDSNNYGRDEEKSYEKYEKLIQDNNPDAQNLMRKKKKKFGQIKPDLKDSFQARINSEKYLHDTEYLYKNTKVKKQRRKLNSGVFSRLTKLDPRLERLRYLNSKKKELLQMENSLVNRYTDSATMKQLNINRELMMNPYFPSRSRSGSR